MKLACVLFVIFLARLVFAEEGVLQVLHKDDFSGRSEHVFMLNGVVLKNVKNKHDWLTGDRVRVSGKRVNGGLEVATMDALALASLPNTFGPHKVLVLLINFYNNRAEPFSLEQIRSVFSSASGFFRENSFSQSWLIAPDIYGWFTSPDMTGDSCESGVTASNQAASSVGVNLADYDHIVHIFPRVSCWFSGLAEIGGSKVYLNGTIDPRIVTHELGHNYGLFHSHSLACAGSSCVINEYGDRFDTMGGLVGHFNAPQKERLGWLNLVEQTYTNPPKPRGKRLRGEIPPLINVNAPDGLHIVAPYEKQNLDAKALKIGNYYLENRIEGGLIVHRSNGDNADYLLDLNGEVGEDWALDVGQIFTDGVVTITPISVNAKGATVHVER